MESRWCYAVRPRGGLPSLLAHNRYRIYIHETNTGTHSSNLTTYWESIEVKKPLDASTLWGRVLNPLAAVPIMSLCPFRFPRAAFCYCIDEYQKIDGTTGWVREQLHFVHCLQHGIILSTVDLWPWVKCTFYVGSQSNTLNTPSTPVPSHMFSFQPSWQNFLKTCLNITTFDN